MARQLVECDEGQVRGIPVGNRQPCQGHEWVPARPGELCRDHEWPSDRTCEYHPAGRCVSSLSHR